MRFGYKRNHRALEPLALADDAEVQVTVDTEMAVSAIALDRQYFCATISGR